MRVKNIKLLKNKSAIKAIIFAAMVTTLSGCGSEISDEINPFEGEPILIENEVEINNKTNNITSNEENEIDITKDNMYEDDINILKQLTSEPFNEDEDIKIVEQADRASFYIILLQSINQDNPLKDVDMEKYMNDHYEELLYSEDDFSINNLEYAALAYQRIMDNNINIMDVMDDLNRILVDQLNPSETSESFNILSTTLNEDENLYDIYFPLAKQLFICTSDEEHYIDENGVFRSDSLDEEYNKIYSIEMNLR